MNTKEKDEWCLGSGMVCGGGSTPTGCYHSTSRIDTLFEYIISDLKEYNASNELIEKIGKRFKYRFSL